MLASAAPKSTAKKDNMNARLAAGEPPWDMLSLKAAIHHAVPGMSSRRHVMHDTALLPQAFCAPLGFLLNVLCGVSAAFPGLA